MITKYLGVNSNYSVVTSEQFKEICKLLLYFYKVGNKVELIYRRDNTLKFLSDYQNSIQPEVVMYDSVNPVIQLQKTLPKNIDEKNSKKNTFPINLNEKTKIKDDKEKQQYEQIKLPETIENPDNDIDNKNNTTRKRSSKPNPFLIW